MQLQLDNSEIYYTGQTTKIGNQECLFFPAKLYEYASHEFIAEIDLVFVKKFKFGLLLGKQYIKFADKTNPCIIKYVDQTQKKAYFSNSDFAIHFAFYKEGDQTNMKHWAEFYIPYDFVIICEEIEANVIGQFGISRFKGEINQEKQQIQVAKNIYELHQVIKDS